MSTLSLHRRPDWQDDAICRQVDGDLFYPERGGDNGDWAKSICRRCDVQEQCLDYALTNREQHGVWGGKTEKERRELLRSAAA